MKKYPSTTEMAGIFPPWAKIRNDDQSVGYGLLNSMGYHVDKMDKALSKQSQNIYLETVNLDETDLLYRVQLPAAFTFTVDTTDPLIEVKEAPTVSGYLSGTPYLVQADRLNQLENFWYEGTPDRYTIDNTVTGVEHNLLAFTASGAPLAVDLDHHLDGGDVWVETTGGTTYIKIEDNELTRARVTIRGTTRVGLETEETMVFPWDMKQKSQREWANIERIEVHDMEGDVQITFRSGDFNNGPYLDAYNARYSDNRRKIDSFWDVGSVGIIPTIDLVTYQSDEFEVLVAGYADKMVLQSWETLDSNYVAITGIDLAVQRLHNRAWVATADGKLYLYDLSEDMVSGVNLLRGRTHGSHVAFDYNFRYIVLGETFTFTPWHARPLKEIESYRIWYQDPSGTKYGILGGTPVAYSSSFTVRGQQFDRTITDKVDLVLNQLGEYVFVVDATFVDGETHTEKVIVKTCFKTPIAELDISSDVSVISGIDFDRDQKLWVRDMTGDYYQVGLHYDTMLIDYERKILYFREPYDSVAVIV